MAQTPEGKVKANVRKILDAYGKEVWYFMPAANGYGRVGIPDFIGCANGWFFGIECKAGNNQPTALQLRELTAIGNAQGLNAVIWDGQEEGVKVWIENLLARNP